MSDYTGLRAALNNGWVQSVHADTVRALLGERDALAAKCQEQARLNRMGSEREARWVAERDALIQDNAGYVEHASKLDAENVRLREALEGMLSEFNEQIPGIVHDEKAVIAEARAALAQEQGKPE